MTHLCVAIFVTGLPQARRDIALAAEAGAEMVELRVDLFPQIDEIIQIISNTLIPCIVTCRPRWEGGQCELSEEDRLDVLARVAEEASPAYLDIELASYHRRNEALLTASARMVFDVPEGSRQPLILSTHDFNSRPDRLYNLLSEMNAGPGDVNKIVWAARTVRDNLEVFEILQQRQKPMIALAMGEEGLISRVLAKKFGAFLTFASIESGAETAPGQVSIRDMKRLYRWDQLNASTKVYGVVGHPVAHSMSPAIHNAAFDEIGHDGVYLPLLVNPGYESFKAFMESFVSFTALDLCGLSVTLPHKENALRYLQEKGAEIDPLAAAIGAVNTIVIDRATAEPKLSGTSTDYSAILDSITSKLGITRTDLADYRVAVIGAGGTGRTAVAALAHYGATVVIYNRTRERADALAQEFNGQRGKVVAAPIEKLCDSCCHIYINTTSVGMHPNVDQSAWGDDMPKLSTDSLVFDSVYNPIRTKFLRQAEDAGAKTINGVEMFVRQAAAQFSAWTARPAPTEIMQRVVESRLAGAPK